MTSREPSETAGAVVELDVREDLRSGSDPFAKIMAAVSTLQAHETLLLRAIFEPVPLLKVLAKRGFVHESHENSTGDWSVRFWRPATNPGVVAAAGASVRAPVPSSPADSGDCAGVARAPEVIVDDVQLDVRGLEPPEPMSRTLEALERLPSGGVLVQINNRIPQLLLPILAERGYAFSVDDSDPERVIVRIQRQS